MRLSLRLALVTALAAASLAASTSPAKADLLPGLLGGGCGSTTQAFAQFGDARDYYFAGGFESGAGGWSVPWGSYVTSGNESYFLHDRSDDSSLLIRNGSTATSNALCFGTTYPGVRFMLRSPSGTGSVRVRIVTRSLLGILSILDGGTVRGTSAWAPTPVLGTLGSQLAVPLGVKAIQVQLTAYGDAQVDDLYVDPFAYDD